MGARAKKAGHGLLLFVLVVSGPSACASSGFDAGSSRSEPTRPLPSSPTSTAPATTPPATTGTGPGAPTAAVDALAVRADPGGGAPDYRRDAFGDGWDYDPASGCNTRERVLVEESTVPAITDDRCRTTTGRWRSSYDGITTTDPADLQIDHVVALADAWRSGAYRWTDERRRAFANDLTSPETLAAVTGRSNQSKGDDAPDQWMPPDRDAWCDYATDWVSIKARWQLSVTAPEKSALVQVLNGC